MGFKIEVTCLLLHASLQEISLLFELLQAFFPGCHDVGYPLSNMFCCCDRLSQPSSCMRPLAGVMRSRIVSVSASISSKSSFSIRIGHLTSKTLLSAIVANLTNFCKEYSYAYDLSFFRAPRTVIMELLSLDAIALAVYNRCSTRADR